MKKRYLIRTGPKCSQRYGACWRSACAPGIVRSVGGCRRPVAGEAPRPPFACRSASLEAVSVQAGPPVLKAATAPPAVGASPVLSPRLWRQPALQRRRREALAALFGAKQPQQRLTAAEHGPAPPGARPHHSRMRPRAARPAGERAARLSGLYHVQRSPASPAHRSSGARCAHNSPRGARLPCCCLVSAFHWRKRCKRGRGSWLQKKAQHGLMRSLHSAPVWARHRPRCGRGFVPSRPAHAARSRGQPASRRRPESKHVKSCQRPSGTAAGRSAPLFAGRATVPMPSRCCAAQSRCGSGQRAQKHRVPGVPSSVAPQSTFTEHVLEPGTSPRAHRGDGTGAARPQSNSDLMVAALATRQLSGKQQQSAQSALGPQKKLSGWALLGGRVARRRRRAVQHRRRGNDDATDLKTSRLRQPNNRARLLDSHAGCVHGA